MRFLTVGLGHCGGKIASSFKKAAKREEHLVVDVCAVNTDKVDLLSHEEIPDENKVCIGSGKGAAKHWREGHKAAVEAKGHIQNMIGKLLHPDTDIVMLTLGEGGGSGSGIAPVCAEVISEQGRECVTLATLPFKTESVKTKVNAAQGLDLLYSKEGVKTLICVDNNKMVARYPNTVVTEAYQDVNQSAIQAFLGLLNLAHKPSQADRIDESELKSIFSYPGFSTLVNYKTPSNTVSNLDTMLQNSWNRSTFADVNPTTATGAILGVYGPTHLFTTTQVHQARQQLTNVIGGQDITLGAYPIKHCPWASYVGIITGLEIPNKIHHLMENAKKEFQRQEQMIKNRKTSKKKGLGFQLPNNTTKTTPEKPKTDRKRKPNPQPVNREPKKEQLRNTEPRKTKKTLEYLESKAEKLKRRDRDMAPTIREVQEAIRGVREKELPVRELMEHVKTQVVASEEIIAACLLELKRQGYLIENTENLLTVV